MEEHCLEYECLFQQELVTNRVLLLFDGSYAFPLVEIYIQETLYLNYNVKIHISTIYKAKTFALERK